MCRPSRGSSAGSSPAWRALLIVPSRGSLDPASLSFGLLISALAAALIGGLTSLPGAFVGGIVIGVAEFLTKWRSSTTGMPALVFFGIVIAVLIFRPGGLFGVPERLAEVASLAPSMRDLPRKLRQQIVTTRARWTFILVGIMLLSMASVATGPFTNGVLIDVIVFAIVGVSLTLLIGYAGQISLGHWALVGVGAFAAGNLYDHSPIPFPLVFPLVFLIGMAVALVIGLPALRIRGPYLAVVTLAFALACYQFIFRLNSIAHGTTGVTFTPQKYGFLNFTSDTNRPLFFFAFAMFLLCAWIAYNFKQSRTGRGFFSLRENEKAAATLGVELTRYRLLAFMLSGGIAALGGAVFVLRQGSVAALDFPVEVSVLLVAMVIIGGLGSITGAALGAFFLFGMQRLLSEALGDPVWVAYVVQFARRRCADRRAHARAGRAWPACSSCRGIRSSRASSRTTRRRVRPATDRSSAMPRRLRRCLAHALALDDRHALAPRRQVCAEGVAERHVLHTLRRVSESPVP